MEIQITQNDQARIIALSGRLDTTTTPELEATLKEASIEEKVLIFDFAELEYISSAGLRVLLASQKKMNAAKQQMTIRNVGATIAEIFEITGMASIFNLE